MHDELELEIFRAGDYGAKGRFDEATLDTIAADYNTTLHEAPVTLDHAQSGPALGWVASLRRAGDRLIARLRGLNGRLLELLRAGAFRKRSIELYPALRETGRPYLRAVSFLGAAAPDVKGLADPLPGGGPAALFREADGGETEADACVVFDEDESALQADAAQPASGSDEQPDSPKTIPTWPAFREIADRLRAAGRWQPAWSERGVEAFYEALAVVEPVRLSGDLEVAPARWFAEFLETLPPVVMMREAAPAGSLPFAGNDGIPRGAAVDPQSLVLHRAALAFQSGHPGTPYAEALRRCAPAR